MFAMGGKSDDNLGGIKFLTVENLVQSVKIEKILINLTCENRLFNWVQGIKRSNIETQLRYLFQKYLDVLICVNIMVVAIFSNLEQDTPGVDFSTFLREIFETFSMFS